MKKIIYIVCILFFLGCVSKKDSEKNVVKTKSKDLIIENRLSNTEKNILNDFLEEELKQDKYKSYKNFQHLLIHKAIGKGTPLIIYGYCYSERNLKIRTASNKDWILDSIEVKKIQDTLNKKNYFWKPEDISILKVNTIEADVIQKSTKSYEEYKKYNNNIIFYISVPIIIKNDYAFVYYNCLISSNGYRTLDIFTVLLIKSKNGKWAIDSYYYDPHSSW